MTRIAHEDGVQFILQPYRETITGAKKQLLLQKLQLLSNQHGPFVRLFKKAVNTVEAVFALEPGYLAGETIYRLLMDGDELISIQQLHPITRKILNTLTNVWLFPAKHYVVSSDRQQDALQAIRHELKDQLEVFEKKGLVLEAERLSRRTRYDLELIEQI